MKKIYQAVVCGKPVENVENYVDYLKKSVDGNISHVVESGENGGKRAELTCRVLKTGVFEGDGQLSLVEIHLKTGRHHQIRVQMAAHGHPVYGDAKYNPVFSDGAAFQRAERERAQLALCAVSLSFIHPATKKQMTFSIQLKSGAFIKFCQTDSE